jgi:hypothetical protein
MTAIGSDLLMRPSIATVDAIADDACKHRQAVAASAACPGADPTPWRAAASKQCWLWPLHRSSTLDLGLIFS